MIRYDLYGHRTVDGRLDMGPVRVPPFVPLFVLEDRTTGAPTLLEIGGTTTTIPTGRPVFQFGPFDGPYIDGHNRLYVESGTTSFEVLSSDLPAVSSPPILFVTSEDPLTIVQVTIENGAFSTAEIAL